jgi:hypothetical protein
VTIPPRILSVLVVIALGLDVVLLVVLVMVSRRRTPPPAVSRKVVADEGLRGVLEGHTRALQRLEGAIRRLAAEDATIAESIGGTMQRVALVRYDAFDDVGGRLSFSCALLDGRGSGVVITSISGRQDTRVYAKPVYGGTSEHNLSEEEAKAIREALGRPEERVEAG